MHLIPEIETAEDAEHTEGRPQAAFRPDPKLLFGQLTSASPSSAYFACSAVPQDRSSL